MDPNLVPAQRRTDLLRVARAHGVTAIRVFGSVARGTAGPRSDLDLLVDLEPGRSLLDVVAFERQLSEMLEMRVQVLTEGALHPLFREQVLAEAVPV